MFRTLFELWSEKDLLNQALNDSYDMIKITREQFIQASSPLFEGTTIEKQHIYDLDKKVNYYQIEVRRKVLEHLSISPQQDTTSALVIITISVDIERLGDYSKNIFELYESYQRQMESNEIFDRIKNIRSNISRMFDETIISFENADSSLARTVMDNHLMNSKACEEIVDTMLIENEIDLTPNQRVLAALSARFLKRVSAHLKNIASSVVNPFDRIGFKPPDQCDEPNKACEYND